MKKLLLGLGAIAAVAAPVAAVVGCDMDLGDMTITWPDQESNKTEASVTADAANATSGLAKATSFDDVKRIMGLPTGVTSTNKFVSASYDATTKKLTVKETMTGDVTMKQTTVYEFTKFAA